MHFTEDLYRIEARIVPDDSRNRLVLDFIQIEKSIFYIHRYRKYLLISTLNIEFWYSIYCFWTSSVSSNFVSSQFWKLPRWISHILLRVIVTLKNMRIFPSFCLSKMCMSHDTWKNSLGKKVHICPCDMILNVVKRNKNSITSFWGWALKKASNCKLLIFYNSLWTEHSSIYIVAAENR